MKQLLVGLLALASVSVFAQEVGSRTVILEEVHQTKEASEAYGEVNQQKTLVRLKANLKLRCDDLSGTLQVQPKCHFNWLGYQYFTNEHRGYSFLCYQGCKL